MISLVIGLLILAAMVALFVEHERRQSPDGPGRTTSSRTGGWPSRLLEGDIVHAGVLGRLHADFDDQTAGAPTDAPTAVPQPCLAYDDPGRRPIESTWSASRCRSTTPTPFCKTAVVTDKLAGTDVLVVRHAETLCRRGSGGNCEAELPASSTSRSADA